MNLKHIYLNTPLTSGKKIPCPKDIWQRLSKVLRWKIGTEFAVFNGNDGLFLAILNDKEIELKQQLQPQPTIHSSLTLLFSLIKKPALDHILRQATECGATYIQPIITDFSVVSKLNIERAEKIIIEAAEQCERLTLPTINAPIKLDTALQKDKYGAVYWANETIGTAPWPTEVQNDNAAILIGPEGGFSESEHIYLTKHSQTISVGLGKHILRADTACVAALSQYWSLPQV